MANAGVRNTSSVRSTASVSNTSSVQGKVFDSISKQGIEGLLVTVYHVTKTVEGVRASAATSLNGSLRLGSVVTDSGGGFALSYERDEIPMLTAGKTRPRPNLLITISAPDDEKGGSADKVIFTSNPPRMDAGQVESFHIAISQTSLDKHDLESGLTAKEAIKAYRRERTQEKELSEGIVAFHKSEVEEDKKEKESLRAELLKTLATDPAKVSLGGELVLDNDNIKDKVGIVAGRGIAKANGGIKGGQGVPVNLYLTPADRQVLQSYFDDAVDGVATIPESVIRPILFRSQGADNPGTLLIHQNPIAKYCSEHTFEEKCAKEHTGIEGRGNGHGPDGDGSEDPGTDILALTDEDIPGYLSKLLQSAPIPDNVLSSEFNGQRPDRETVEASVDSFSLRKGPADVPAHYDFHSLQIAFEHVWKILVDEDIVNVGHTLEKKYAAKTGLKLSAVFPRNWTDILVGANVYTSIPQEVPAEVAAQFDINLQEWTDLSASHQAKLKDIAKQLTVGFQQNLDINLPFRGIISGIVAPRLGSLHQERKRQELREQGERLIDAVRHDDYYTLHKTLRDLHARVNSAYEFTVFAADKNYHSVNFGLMNTYRQQWAPINYQAGKLVKTIPLSPKEERKYSLKVTRNLKQARKEAVKNNQALTNEQTSTSRVEAEIMEKAQNQTNFGLSTDGSYNIGISKGKSTTTFGVEALQESSGSRKDFREAVIKAVQEYKEERSVDIDTEETSGSEYTESGSIVNPNDELSVTYLFYELQRRYRVSEQLYRVMPVVLVAQEVPAPHQITEAWVIAHDWILNRTLLDDSFRPALGYLANKSVGDDFALRELRKNLRQQRNLVDTLRLELAIASNEAENRYRALENSIERRIGEESAETTDGWFADVGDFFGGGGQDPEAAKARELAAKDAHQHAVEKAEKAAAALRQEMSTLHVYTNEYNNTLRTHLDNETRVKRLLAHIRANIFHYMQAIWSMEPPDQRFLRLHKAQVPVLELATVPNPEGGPPMADRHYEVQVEAVEDIFAGFREPGTSKHKAFMSGTLKPITAYKPLVEVADLDSPLGYKGNYMIFPLKEHNALTEFMAAPYVDSAFGAMDPDDLSNVNLNDYGKYVCCLHDRLPAEEFEALKPLLKKWLELLLSDPLRNGDEITVPTDSLFIEILPGAHPLLENFKLRHRELDVYMAAENLRKGRLENLRLAKRLMQNKLGDPDIEKKIVIGGNGHAHVDVDTDN